MSSDVYRGLKSELDQGKKAVMITFVSDGKTGGDTSHKKLILTEEQLRNSDTLNFMDETAVEKAQLALKTGNLQYFQSSNGTSIMIEPYFPEPHLIVLGGGHIAKPLVEFGAKVGFSVTVVDDRPIFANKYRFPDAEKVICESFSNCFNMLKLHEASFVVIVTRGHRHDLDCLKQVLNNKTAYVGMIGSKRRVNSIREQLKPPLLQK